VFLGEDHGHEELPDSDDVTDQSFNVHVLLPAGTCGESYLYTRSVHKLGRDGEAEII
jgi:hypothetical protein